MRSISVWKPDSFEHTELLASHERRVAEGVLYLGHLVLTGLATNAKNRECGSVPLKTKYLQNVIGRHHWSKVKQLAESVGYIACEAGYSSGKRSRTYSICPPYDTGKLAKHHLSDPGLCLNVLRWQEQRHCKTRQRINSDKTLIAPEVCGHLWKNLQRLEIDDIAEFDHPAHEIAAEFIKEKDHWFKVDDYGRIHTPVTNLPGKLRKSLSVGGERLANIDIGESQPLFLGLTAMQGCRDAGEGDVGGGAYSGGEPPYGRHTYVRQEYLTSGGISRDRLSPDLADYLTLCERRGLYQTVADTLGATVQASTSDRPTDSDRQRRFVVQDQRIHP